MFDRPADVAFDHQAASGDLFRNTLALGVHAHVQGLRVFERALHERVFDDPGRVVTYAQFQIDDGELVLSAYQRSSDANLGLPADIYHLYLMARQIDLPLKSITLNLGNVHIYENNQERTRQLLAGDENVKFDLNV